LCALLGQVVQNTRDGLETVLNGLESLG